MVVNRTKEDILNASITKSHLWKYFRIYQLKSNMRFLQEDFLMNVNGCIQNLADWILFIGDGIAKTISRSHIDDEKNCVEIPEELLIKNNGDSFTNIIYAVYSDFCEKYRDPLYLKERIIVTPKNEIAYEINKKKMFDMMPFEEKTYYSFDSLCKISANSNELEILYLVDFFKCTRI